MISVLLGACTGSEDPVPDGAVLYTDDWELVADLRDIDVAGPEAQHPHQPLDLVVSGGAFRMPAFRQVAGQDWVTVYIRHQPGQGTYYPGWSPVELESSTRGVRSGTGNRDWILTLTQAAGQTEAFVFYEERDAGFERGWSHMGGAAERHLAAVGGTFSALATGVINADRFGTVRFHTASSSGGVQPMAPLPDEPDVHALGLGLDGYDPVAAYTPDDDRLTAHLARWDRSLDVWEPIDTVALEAPLYMADAAERLRLDVISVFVHDGATTLLNRRPPEEDADLHLYHQPSPGAPWSFGAVDLGRSRLHDLEHVDGTLYAVACDDPAVSCQPFTLEGTAATPLGSPLPDIFNVIRITAAEGRAYLVTGDLDVMILGEVQ